MRAEAAASAQQGRAEIGGCAWEIGLLMPAVNGRFPVVRGAALHECGQPAANVAEVRCCWPVAATGTRLAKAGGLDHNKGTGNAVPELVARDDV